MISRLINRFMQYSHEGALFIFTVYGRPQWRIQRRGKSGHGPHRSCQWSLAPRGGRKSNDGIV